MKLRIDYDAHRHFAKISIENGAEFSWNSLCRLTRDEYQQSIISGNSIFMPWYSFLSFKTRLATAARTMYKADIEITPAATQQLMAAAQKGYYNSIRISPISEMALEEKLKSVGFIRTLTEKQKRNICKLAPLPAGATFSVPGAGKTTEALAYFFFNATEADALLVVAPKNAFSAWDEQLVACLNNTELIFERLRGGASAIERKLMTCPKFTIISYQQFPRVRDLIYRHLEKHPTFMFLDESHRIKSGSNGVSPEAIISASHLPIRKLILSGTPMPQSETDLDPQLSFLYPDISISDGAAAQLIQPIYVRTTKAELELPEVIYHTKRLSMPPKQRAFYDLMRSETNRQLQGVSRNNSQFMRKLGRSIIKLMQFVSNPALLARDMNYMFDERLSDLLLSEKSIKIEYACKRARELAKENQKCIIWSSFVDNVELISRHLADIGADFIHGGVDAGSEADEDSREGKIKRFHNDPNAMVLVANPAAASEGISLHKICHTAIYVDRSFNVAQYLQSVDRIHRYGLDKDIITNIEILECTHTVDQIATFRLSEKIGKMANVLNDPSIMITADPYAFEDDVDLCGIDDSDVDAIMQYLGGAHIE